MDFELLNQAKTKDQELYDTWKASGDKADLGKLVNHLHPLIYSEVRKVAGTLPESALSAEAKKWTVKAIQTYDPSRGAGLSTHVVSYLRKVKRMNYNYQNAARLPENLHLQWQTFNRTVSHLQESLNRDPSDDEIAKEMGWSKPNVVKFKSRLYEDLSESGAVRPTETTQFNSNKFFLDHIISQLDEQEKYILLNKGDVPAQEMCDKLGVNVSRLNYLISKLTKKIETMKHDIGMY